MNEICAVMAVFKVLKCCEKWLRYVFLKKNIGCVLTSSYTMVLA
jgi:hypothetical protein